MNTDTPSFAPTSIPAAEFASTGELNGLVALVTGGSRGIGAAIVRRLASGGANVFFTFASSQAAADALVQDVRRAGGRATALRADSADPDALRAAVETAAQANGTLDIVVNSAGILMVGPFESFGAADIDRMLAVNVKAPFVLAQQASRHMTFGGRIVMIGSVVGSRAGVAGGTLYTLTKTAIGGMVRGLAHDLAPRGITVNNVQPGPTRTDMNPDDSPFHDTILKMLPLGRFGEPSEVAGMVAYLVGPDAGFVTGASFTVDGGMLA